MHPSTTQITTGNVSVLAALRALVPSRRLTLSEALRLAELQAGCLLRLHGIDAGPVSEDVVTNQPRIVIESDADLPVHAASGCSRWDVERRCWVISLNPDEPLTRQRFTVLHEYKHILDHYSPGLSTQTTKRFDPVEYVADYFAGCVLTPKQWLKAAYFSGIQSLSDLSNVFDVSPRAIEVRLAQVGITSSPAELGIAAPRYRRQRPFFKPLIRTGVARQKAPVTNAPQGEHRA